MAKSPHSTLRQYGIVIATCLILVLQASASHLLKIDERAISTPGLRELSWQLGPWKASEEQSMEPATMAYLKPDDYILRDYVDRRGGGTTGLFVAYFKSLQNVYGPHSPRVCLPGAGWLVTSSKIASVTVPKWREPIPVNQVMMEKGNQRILVFYWYQNDRDVWAEEFRAKLHLLPDLVRYRRSDVSLVRLITPLTSQTGEAEVASSVEFTKQVFPLLEERFASVTVQRP